MTALRQWQWQWQFKMATAAMFVVIGLAGGIFAAQTWGNSEVGAGLTATLDDDGTLTISGSSNMADYRGDAPWQNERIVRVVIEDGVNYIGYAAFASIYSIKSVKIGDGVKTIESFAFYATDLTSVTIGSGVKTIGRQAFNGCSNLKEVTIGNSVETIESSAFDNCAALTSFIIPNSVEIIGGYAFYDCGSLEKVTIGSGVYNIGDYAFGNTAFTSITSLNPTPPILYNNIFNSVPGIPAGTTCLTVPSGSVDDYKNSAYGWNEFTCIRTVSAPDAPTGVTATAGKAQAEVTFTAPVNNGGFAITGYTVTSFPEGKTASGASSHITVAGLTNGTAYTFTVTAANAIGTGAESGASNSVTPATVPGAPTDVKVEAGNGQVKVSFTAPASNGGSAITEYIVTSSPEGKTGTGQASPITVTGLTNGKAYTFTVAAKNAVGTGAESAASAPATPVSVLSENRVIPNAKPGEEATVVAPTGQLSGEFTAGPNPVAKSAGVVNFFRQGKRVSSGELRIYDATGNIVGKVQIVDKALNTQARRQVGSWDLTDRSGRTVSEGTYLVKGVLKTSDGKREKVSVIVGVR